MARDVTLALAGEVDLANADTWLADAVAVLGSGPVGTVRLDLGHATFLDSSGLNAVMRLRRHVTSSGGELFLVADPPPRIRDLLQLTGLLMILTEPTPASRAAGGLQNIDLVGVRTIEEGEANPAATMR